MADTSRTQLRTSKRKRVQVNYYEEPASDDEEVTLNDEELKEIEEHSRAKVCWPMPVVRLLREYSCILET